MRVTNKVQSLEGYGERKDENKIEKQVTKGNPFESEQTHQNSKAKKKYLSLICGTTSNYKKIQLRPNHLQQGSKVEGENRKEDPKHTCICFQDWDEQLIDFGQTSKVRRTSEETKRKSNIDTPVNQLAEFLKQQNIKPTHYLHHIDWYKK